MCNGRGEADLRAQRRDHEGPRVEHGAGAKRAPLTGLTTTQPNAYFVIFVSNLKARRTPTCPWAPASGAAEDQAANRRERCEDIDYRYR